MISIPIMQGYPEVPQRVKAQRTACGNTQRALIVIFRAESDRGDPCTIHWNISTDSSLLWVS